MSSSYKYQLVIIGAKTTYEKDIARLFYERVNDLGLSKDTVAVFDAADFYAGWSKDAPTVGVYFGQAGDDFPDESILSDLIANASYILPIVENLASFPQEIPQSIVTINGMGLNRSSVDEIVGVILEAFGLLRLSRRLFISYKRTDSMATAIQLYEELDSAGFDVFLDTHSVRPVVEFQEELWHRLADTDVVVLIDTQQYRNSKWTMAELEQATAMSIGIFQLVWPGHTAKDDTGFCYTKTLNNTDFETTSTPDQDSKLKKTALSDIKRITESLRARNLSARQNLLIGNFIDLAKAAGRRHTLQPQRFITYFTKTGEEIVVIPTVGVPDAYGFHFSDQQIKRIHEKEIKQVYFLYDKTNIKESWQQHLNWLNVFLPVKSVSLNQLSDWVQNN